MAGDAKCHMVHYNITKVDTCTYFTNKKNYLGPILMVSITF